MSQGVSAAAYAQALAHLLPPGAAWPRDPDSVWMRLLAGLARALAELQAHTEATVAQWQPATTTLRLAEWEAATGLPDACFGASQSVDERRARLLARLRGPMGAYADSSPAAPQALADYCTLVMGAPVAVARYVPFRVGRDRCGARLGRNGQLIVAVPVGLMAREAQLRCALEAVVPARFLITIVAA